MNLQTFEMLPQAVCQELEFGRVRIFEMIAKQRLVDDIAHAKLKKFLDRLNQIIEVEI